MLKLYVIGNWMITNVTRPILGFGEFAMFSSPMSAPPCIVGSASLSTSNSAPNATVEIRMNYVRKRCEY